MRLNPVEVLNSAEMTGERVVLVEGRNDVRDYEKIFNNLNLNIIPVEIVEGCEAGCRGIVYFYGHLRGEGVSSDFVERNSLGIIDKDVRDYRGEMPNDPCIFPLRYYSIESHFVAREVLVECLNVYSRVPAEYLGSEALSSIIFDIKRGLESSYYYSLDALRGSVEPGYNSEFSYSDEPGKILDYMRRGVLPGNTVDLDIFAQSIGLGNDFDSILKIARGKWVPHIISKFVCGSIEGLGRYCGSHGSRRCSYCLIGGGGGCLYGPACHMDRNSVAKTIISVPNNEMTLYIRDKALDHFGLH